jgi:protein translocase SecG subunit
MGKGLVLAQIVISVLLTASILLQNRGAGLSATFGGDSGGYYTKRGFDKFLYWSAIILSALFLAVAVSNVYVISKGL